MLNALLIANPDNGPNKLVADLLKYQIECFLAADACAALQNSDIKVPDVLLLETDPSPEIEVLWQYLKENKKIPVISLLSVENIATLNPAVDDFVIKPYRAAEIAVRIQRLSRQKLALTEGQIIAGNLIIDTVKYEVSRNGNLIELTFKEYELLKFLAGNPGRVYTRDALLNQIWGEDYFGGDRTVDVHIRRLREKIENGDQAYIETVRNIGYRFKKH